MATATAISAAPQDQTSNLVLSERKILNKILTDGGHNIYDGSFAPSAIAQQITCGSNSLDIYGIYPTIGSELGGTPVAVAFRVNTSEATSQSELNQNGFDLATISCQFGQYVQPVRGRSDLGDELLRLAVAANVTGDVSLGSELQLLVCLSPRPDAVPGPLPFAISCKNGEMVTNQASTMTFSFTIAASVSSIIPLLGRFRTEVTVKGGGFRNSSSLMCFFGKKSALKVNFTSSDEIRCTAPDLDDGEFPVAVSNNGVDVEGEWTTTTFAYVPLPVIVSMKPQTMTWTSTSTVGIIGKHFTSHPKVVPICSFDDHPVTSAVVESDNVITCALPPFEYLSDQSPFISIVRLSTNGGADFSTSSVRAFFYHPVELLSYSLDVGSTITVHGKNFHEAVESACLFQLDGGDFIKIPAKFHSMFRVQCQVPQSGYGHAQLWVVSTDGESGKSLNSLNFAFSDSLALLSIDPSEGIIGGGTDIIVRVIGFYEDFSIVCRFGVSIIVATVLNSTFLSCVSPPATLALAGGSFGEWVSPYNQSGSTVVSLEVSANGGHSFTQSGTTFQYSDAGVDDMDMNWDVIESASGPFSSVHPKIKLMGLLPPRGSALGGTDVEVQGSNMFQGLTCLFGNTESPFVKFLSSSRIVCRAPAAASSSLHSSAVDVALTLNTGEAMSNSLRYTYHSAILITSFFPTFGTLYGGTSVHIHGAAFFHIDGLSPTCLFSSTSETSLAIIVSSTLVVCTIPQAYSANATTVSLSFNGGYDVVTAAEVFKYVSPAVITSVSPRFVSSNGEVEVAIRGANFIPEGNLSGVWRCSFGDTVVVATAVSADIIFCLAPPMKPGMVDLRVSINGIDFSTQSATVIYHIPPEILEVIPPFSRESGGGLITVRGSNFQPSPDLSCIFSTSRDSAQAVEAIFESDTQVKCIVPSSDIGMASATLEISVSDDALDNPRIAFWYHQLISVSSIKLDESSKISNDLVLEATGFHSVQDELVCQVMMHGDDGSIVFSRSKVHVLSQFEIRCAVPPVVLKHHENEFSILLGIVYDEIFYQLTDPRIEPKLLSQIHKHFGIGHSQTPSNPLEVNEVWPTVFSEIGGSTINFIVTSYRVMSENIVCLFSKKGETNGSIQESTASIITRHHISEDGTQSGSSLVVSTTPRLVPGQYIVSIESSDVVSDTFFTPEFATITIIPAFSVTKFEPLSGSSGTEMTVYGSGFPNITLSCKVEGRISGAIFLSNEKLVCPIPTFDYSQILPHPFLTVSVSANGQDFYEIEGSKFFVTEPPHVSDILPAEGSVMGDKLTRETQLL